MGAAKILGVSLGILMICGGLWCLTWPESTFFALAWVIGLCMLIDGISNVFTWFQLRKFEQESAMVLALAVLSIVCGIILLISNIAQITFELLLSYIVAAWLIIGGIMRIISGMQRRKLYTALGTRFFGGTWWFSVLLGCLIILLGVLCLINPIILAIGIGALIGFSVIIAGFTLIGVSLALPVF